MSLKGLEQAIANLESISKTAVPRASSQAINRIATRAISRSTREVAKTTKVQRKLVNQRARLKKATVRKPQAVIKVNRGNLPAIKLGPASLRLSRRKKDKYGTRSILQVGRFRFPNAFIQQLSNGRWHVLQRTTAARYPLKVVSIPMAEPLTTAFKAQSKKLTDTDLPKEMAAALRNQLRLIITK
ncbi:MAG: phage tail protein [Leclercia sp.]